MRFVGLGEDTVGGMAYEIGRMVQGSFLEGRHQRRYHSLGMPSQAVRSVGVVLALVNGMRTQS